MSKVTDELQRLIIEHGGQLTPAELVEAARPPSSPLHGYLEWDDSVAGHNWRLAQARRLLEIRVEHYAVSGERLSIPVAVSVPSERPEGYRQTLEVMSSEDAAREVAFSRMQQAISLLSGFPHPLTDAASRAVGRVMAAQGNAQAA